MRSREIPEDTAYSENNRKVHLSQSLRVKLSENLQKCQVFSRVHTRNEVVFLLVANGSGSTSELVALKRDFVGGYNVYDL